MNTRLQIAAMAMQGILSNDGLLQDLKMMPLTSISDAVATLAVSCADALLEADHETRCQE